MSQRNTYTGQDKGRMAWVSGMPENDIWQSRQKTDGCCKSAVFGIIGGDLFAENIIYGDNDILSGILFPAETCR